MRQARILREREYFFVADEGSAKGSYVNGRRVERPVLRPGDARRTPWHPIE